MLEQLKPQQPSYPNLQNYPHQAIKTINFNIIKYLQEVFPTGPNAPVKSLHAFNYREAERCLFQLEAGSKNRGDLFIEIMRAMHKSDDSKFPQGLHVDYFLKLATPLIEKYFPTAEYIDFMEGINITMDTEFIKKPKSFNDRKDQLKLTDIGEIFVPIIREEGITVQELERVVIHTSPYTILPRKIEGDAMTTRRWLFQSNTLDKPMQPSILNLYKLCVILKQDFNVVCEKLSTTTLKDNKKPSLKQLFNK